jgi:protein ImuA
MPRPQSNTAADALAGLLQDSPLVWRGRDLARPKTRTTGYPVLDEHLPGGGWPLGALIEILPACEGLGELSLSLPLLRSLCRDKRPVAIVCPPYIPYAPALMSAGVPLASVLWVDAARDEDARWSTEQILRGGQAGAVLLWSPTEDDRSLRRLQLAAELGNAFSFVYRPTAAIRRPSPAALRVALYPAHGGTRADLFKVRGGHAASVTLSLHSAFA